MMQRFWPDERAAVAELAEPAAGAGPGTG
jgi:hypothetical protein